MRVFTLNELMILTRAQLFALHSEIAALLYDLPEGSEEYLTVLTNLRNIRCVLARRQHAPS